MADNTEVYSEPFTTSPEINELAKALAHAQGACTDPKRGQDNPAFSRGGKPFRYADLQAVLEIIRDANKDAGLALTMPPFVNGHRAGVEWLLMHESGQWMRGKCLLPVVTMERGGALVSNMTPQEIGKAVTYASRYTASRLYNIASQDDDDGNSISGVADAHHPTPPSTTSSRSASAPAPAAAAKPSPPKPDAPATARHKEALSAALKGRHVDPDNVAARNAFGVAVLSAGYPGRFKDLTAPQTDLLILAAEEGPDAMPDAELQAIWRKHTAPPPEPEPAKPSEFDPFGDD